MVNVRRVARSSMGTNRSNDSSMARLKWTKELHDLFEKAVHQIGGPDRASPKRILRAMGIPGLTIFHVKSHLQKYRMQVFTLEEDHTRGKLNKKSVSEMLANFSALSGAQLNEALQIQVEAQRQLSDQFEEQRSLKLKIEAQDRFLDKIMEEYKNRSPLTKLIKSHPPFLMLPSLIEESGKSNEKESDSDSEVVETIETTSKDDFHAQKRIKIWDDTIQQMHKFKFTPLDPRSRNLNMFSLDGVDNHFYADQDIGLSWSIGSFSSPLLPAIYNPLNQ